MEVVRMLFTKGLLDYNMFIGKAGNTATRQPTEYFIQSARIFSHNQLLGSLTNKLKAE